MRAGDRYIRYFWCAQVQNDSIGSSSGNLYLVQVDQVGTVTAHDPGLGKTQFHFFKCIPNQVIADS